MRPHLRFIVGCGALVAMTGCGAHGSAGRDENTERIVRDMKPEVFSEQTPGADGIALDPGAPALAEQDPEPPPPSTYGVPGVIGGNGNRRGRRGAQQSGAQQNGAQQDGPPKSSSGRPGGHP